MEFWCTTSIYTKIAVPLIIVFLVFYCSLTYSKSGISVLLVPLGVLWQILFHVRQQVLAQHENITCC